MSFSDFYATGTVTVPAGGTAVVGAGTLWSTPIVAGDTLEAGGRAVRILDVVDNTHLTLAYGWPGAALAGSSYIIVFNSPSRTTGAYVAERLRELIERQRILDDGVPTYVAKGAGTNAPPSSPAASDLYLVGSAPTGAWAGYGGYLAVATDAGAWRFTAPAQGMRLYNTATDATWERHAAGWVNISPVSTSALGAANGVATLDSGGKVPAAQLPALAITETFPVASQAAMLALTAQVGDVAIRSDIRKSFILSASPATTLANWLEILAPLGAVSSVAGRTGDVTLGTADVSGLDASLAGKLATGTRTICIPVAAFTPRSTNPPAWGLTETASNKRMVRSLDFDPATAEYAQVCLPMPKSWNKGYPYLWTRVLWAPSDGSIGNVRWAVRAVCVDFYDGTDHLDRAWGTAIAAASASSGQSTATCYTDVPNITIDGTPADNTLMFIEVYRDAANAADTYTADAKLLALYVHVNINLPNDA